MSTEEAGLSYSQLKGNSLTKPHPYGFDPISLNGEKMKLREERFYERFQSNKEIFENVMGGNKLFFEQAICFFQNETIDLSL